MSEVISQTVSVHTEKTPTQSVSSSASSRWQAFLGWGFHSLANLAVLTGLVGLAWWGHSTGWKFPKYSQVTSTETAKQDDWCAEHGVPESICIECKKDLVPKHKPFGWCKTHGVAECVLDHPELAQVQKSPTLPKYDVLAALNMVERPSNNHRCKLHERRIQFATVDDVAKAGIDVEEVQERRMLEFKTANGEVGYDQTKLARLSSRLPGIAWWVIKNQGETVRRGEVLALIDAAEVGKAKTEFLQALATVDQKSRLQENVESLIRQGVYKEGASQQIEARAGMREAETRLLAAQQALVNLGLFIPDGIQKMAPNQQAAAIQFLGIPQELVQQLSNQVTSGLLPIKAPFDGIIVLRDVVTNEVVDATKPLFVVADLNRMWLTLNVRQDEMAYVKVGQKILFSEGDRKDEVEGRITWISTAVDEKTRTVSVRAELENKAGVLRANAFGTGKVILRDEQNAITVPNDAVQWEGDCFVVFVRDKNYFKKDAPKFFHVRTVRPGAKDAAHTELLAGVLPGEIVATKGSGVLRSELLKNNLGEG